MTQEIILYDNLNNMKTIKSSESIEKIDFIPKIIKISPLSTVTINNHIILNNPYKLNHVYVKLNISKIDNILISKYTLPKDHLNNSKTQYICYFLLCYLIFYSIIFITSYLLTYTKQ